MAMSYGKYGSNKKNKIIYSIITVIVLALAAGLFFYNPFKKTTPPQPTEIPAETPVAQPLVETPAEEPASEIQSQPQTQTEQPPAEVNSPVSSLSPRVASLLDEAQRNTAEGRVIAARNILNDVLNMEMKTPLRQNVKKQMEELAQDWLFSRVVHPGDNLCTTYNVQPGDILANVAARYKVPYQLLMRLNNIRSDKGLQAGQTIKVVQGPFHAVVYLSSYTMDLYLQNIYVRSYQIGIGKEGHETPPGLWRVKQGGKLIKPTWTDPETGIVYHAEDPDYPLGSGWIALEGIDSRTRGIDGIAIHGTNDESTIGTKSSRGCIRLFNGELKEVYDMLEPGDSELRVVE